MALQNENALAMNWLGILNDNPVDALQPKLSDGVHLRWSFGKTRAFPWYGYYLLRRPAKGKPRQRLCLANSLKQSANITHVSATGFSLNSILLSLHFGFFISDRDLVITDDFPATGTGELDLRNRKELRFSATNPLCRLSYRVGLRRGQGTLERDCIDFDREDEGHGPNPVRKGKVRFTICDSEEQPARTTDFFHINEDHVVLGLGRKAIIDLPCAAREVVLVLVNQGGEGKLIARSATGEEAIRIPKSGEPINLDIRGEGITRIEIYLPQNEAALQKICYVCAGNAAEEKPLTARFYSGPALLREDILTGNAGDILGAELVADHITAIEFSGGEAALVDLCCTEVQSEFSGHWEPVPKLKQPIALPVRDTDYPASGSLPTDLVSSRTEALGRISYGNPADWNSEFSSLHKALEELVTQGPGGPAMQDTGANNVPAAGNPENAPNLSRLRQLDYITLGSLYAPVAQMLGLYYVDRSAKSGEVYDYLLVADHTNVGKNNIATLVQWLNGPSFNTSDIDAWICFNCSLATPAPLASPKNLKSYALPGTTIEQPNGTLRDATNNAGLLWDLDRDPSGKLKPHGAVMYVVRRSTVSATEPSAPLDVALHQPVSKTPQLVAKTQSPAGPAPEKPGDWPPNALCHVDSALAEGWYSYIVNGVDVFGRYSAPGLPAAWHLWVPAPDPKPWYFKNGLGNGAVHNFAISLLDKKPPPPPTAIEAFALDPKDPELVRDGAYNSWLASLTPPEAGTVTGLRVRWLWTWAHMRQAPDASQFRLYWKTGQANLLKGKAAGIAGNGANQTAVTTTLTHAFAANALAGLYMRQQARSFKIVSHSAVSPLVLVVENLLPDHSVKPVAGEKIAIAITPAHPLYQNVGRAQFWENRFWTVPLSQFKSEAVIPAQKPGSTQETLAGEHATATAQTISFPVGTDLSGIRPFNFHLYLSEDTARSNKIYRITAVNIVARTVNVDGAPSLTGGQSGWEVGQLARRYEVFLPAAGDADRAGLSLLPTRENPVAYGLVGISTADNKTHSADDPRWSGRRFGDQPGNESAIGGPATVFTVLRTPPPAPVMPPDSGDVYASRADYYGKSYYTFRWPALADVNTHIFRALDDSIYQRDWEIRRTRQNLAASDQAFFPDGWNTARRAAAATALNAIASVAAYATLSADAREVLGRLPGNEGFKSLGTLPERDWLIRHTRQNLAGSELAFFPADWGNALKRQQAASALNGISAFASYKTLSNDAKRVLAALPGLETAYQQITDKPLSNIGAETANRRGPDNPASFPILPGLRAYSDAIDGRSTNRYFYRAAYIDTAQNIGAMGLASPPVRVPDIMPPRAPVFTRVLAGDPDPDQPGDRKITLRWSSNREEDLASYLVYRTEDEKNTRDVRLMTLVHTVTVAPSPPEARPKEVVWLDDTVLGLVTYHYGLVATDTQNNRSAASTIIAARAYDQALPDIPVLSVAFVEQAGQKRAEVSWTSPHHIMVQRKEGGGNWIDLAQWREPGTVTIRDPFSKPEKTYQYRAIARKYTGAIKRGDAVLLEAEE